MKGEDGSQVDIYIVYVNHSTYDVEGQGYLRESDLENYIFELIGAVPALRSMPVR